MLHLNPLPQHVFALETLKVSCPRRHAFTPQPIIFPHQLNEAYHGNHAAGADAVVDADHALVVGVLPPAEEVLVAQVVRPLIHHEAAALHPDGVAAVEVGVQVGTVAHALMVPTLEISVLVEYDL